MYHINLNGMGSSFLSYQGSTGALVIYCHRAEGPFSYQSPTGALVIYCHRAEGPFSYQASTGTLAIYFIRAERPLLKNIPDIVFYYTPIVPFWENNPPAFVKIRIFQSLFLLFLAQAIEIRIGGIEDVIGIHYMLTAYVVLSEGE
jgi:hypothetical protein